NPFQMVAAGLLARNAARRGMKAKPWVKTSLSPGSRVVSSMLSRAGLIEPLADLGFHVVGYGCMSCGGGAGPIADEIATEIAERKLTAVGVLSSNRNFEGRLSPSVRGTYLASPPMVVAYAIAGSVLIDMTREAIGADREGRPVRLDEIWPSDEDIREVMSASLGRDLYERDYGKFADPGAEWDRIAYGRSSTFDWPVQSTYLKRPPFVEGVAPEPAPIADITGARTLLILGDNITTDHISPGGAIPASTMAGRYLIEEGVKPQDFDRYIARRANHEVMIRGTFANIRVKNEMVPEREGGWTRLMPDGTVTSIHEAAETYRQRGIPLVVVAGRNYGNGSSRDWAAKGTSLLGVKAVIAEGFERIHRSNLIGMGVLPLQFPDGISRKSLALDGSEVLDLTGLSGGLAPGAMIECRIGRPGGGGATVSLKCRIDTASEVEWYRHGGILPYAFRKLVAAA
ncbi:MAG: aconitate hydratase, partial [Proteobacteria bacterium]|nr:aconitate hydratase [Pseudomonadota bacterium]